MKKKLLYLALAALMSLAAFMPLMAAATVVPTTYYATAVSGSSFQANQATGDTVGTLFEVGNSPFEVLSLGVWDRGSNGLGSSHPVGIYDVNGSLLASATVLSGTASPLAVGFRWAALSSPLTLSANTQYVIAAWYDTNNDWFKQCATINSNFTYIVGRYQDNTGGLAFPGNTWNLTPGGFFGPNLAGNPVPIPAAIWLLGAGLMGLVGIRRKVRS